MDVVFFILVCHDGTKLSRWYLRGWRVAGIDLNPKAIKAAKKFLPDGVFYCGDLLTTKLNKKFDYIRSDNVIEHLIEPIKYLKILYSLLEPDGKLGVFVPNGAALSVKIFGRYSAVYWMPFHLNIFTKTNLRIALEKAGFINVRIKTFTPVGSWIWTQRQFL